MFSRVDSNGIDTHIHFICPQQIDEALASGITTMIGGGTGPATGTFAALGDATLVVDGDVGVLAQLVGVLSEPDPDFDIVTP